MKEAKRITGKWWLFSFLSILFLIPFFQTYLYFVLSNLVFKMQNIKELGYFPLIDPDILKGLSSFYLFNSSLFYAIPLGLLLGTLFWTGWIIKNKKFLYLFLFLSLLFTPIFRTPDSYRNIREKLLVKSEGGKAIINWYYSYTLLAAEGIKGFWEKEEKFVYFAGKVPDDFKRWAKKEGIIYKEIQKGKNLKGFDLVFNSKKGVKWEGIEKTEISLSLPLKVLRFLLFISFFIFFPFYIIFSILTLIFFLLYYFKKSKMTFSLIILLVISLFAYFLPVEKTPTFPDSIDKLKGLVFSNDYYTALKSVEKISNTYQGKEILKEILPLERRWYIRVSTWEKLKEKGWDGKISSLER